MRAKAWAGCGHRRTLVPGNSTQQFETESQLWYTFPTRNEYPAGVYQAARLSIFDVTVMVVFADASFDQKAPVERRTVCAAIQQTLEPSDFGVNVVLVWQDADGRMKFIAPPRQERFFLVMRYDQLYAQADRYVTVTPA